MKPLFLAVSLVALSQLAGATEINVAFSEDFNEALADRPRLDALRSISLGGMKLQATAFDGAGCELTELEYGWFETDIRQSVGKATWSDAKRASDRFARKFAEQLNIIQ